MRVIFLSNHTSDCFRILHSSLIEHKVKSYRKNLWHFYFQGHILTIFVNVLVKIQFWWERGGCHWPGFWPKIDFFGSITFLMGYWTTYMQNPTEKIILESGEKWRAAWALKIQHCRLSIVTGEAVTLKIGWRNLCWS